MIKKSVLLINPLKNTLAEGYEAYPSGALVLIGTMLHNRGHRVRIVHMLADGIGIREIGRTVAQFEPDVVGITMGTFQTKCAREVARVVKGVNERILVVVGGPHPSALKQKIFRDFPHVDVVIPGEGEHAFLEIVEGRDLAGIRGIFCPGRTHTPRPLAEDLDYVPLPNLDLVGFRKRKFLGLDPVGALPSMHIMGTRGCPFQCIFCNKSVWGTTVRVRRPERIVEEIRWLRTEYGVREVYFLDDTFNLDRKWAEEIFHGIIDGGLHRGMRYKATFRANERFLDAEFLALAKEAGVWLVLYGAENGNQAMLDRMKKGITIGELKRAFDLTHRAGLKTTGSFIIGLPGETPETIGETLELQKTLRPFTTGISPAIPFPGTEFEREVSSKGHLLSADYDEYAPGNVVIRTDDLSKDQIESYCRTVPDAATKLRKLKHRLSDLNYLGNLIGGLLREPAVVWRRAKGFLRSMARAVSER